VALRVLFSPQFPVLAVLFLFARLHRRQSGRWFVRRSRSYSSISRNRVGRQC
jgi:hypothetical protein